MPEYFRDGVSWITTYTGKEVYPFSPIEDDIDVVDIAHALSLKVRFTGHCNYFYSVAEHSLIISSLFEDPMLAYWGLHHDDDEAYLPDLASPLAALLPEFIERKENLMSVIARKLHLPYPKPPEIKLADIRVLLNEKKDLLVKSPTAWGLERVYKPYPWIVLSGERNWQSVEQQFLDRHEYLSKHIQSA